MVLRSKGINVGVAEDDGVEMLEHIAWQRLGNKSANICDVRQCRMVMPSVLTLSFSQKIADVDVPGFWPGGYVTVCLECNGIFIIVLEKVVANVLTLCLQEHLDLNGVKN
jgi:hypothetical protein